MLGHHLRRCPNITPTLGQCPVSAGDHHYLRQEGYIFVLVGWSVRLRSDYSKSINGRICIKLSPEGQGTSD